MSFVNRQALRFFLLTFLFSWLLWLPGVLITQGLLPPGARLKAVAGVCNWVAGTGPSLVALLLVLASGGKPAVRRIFARVLQARLGPWYWPTFLLLPVIIVAAHLVNLELFHVPFPRTGLLAEPWWIPVVFALCFLMQFGEELGWRGYALDLLQTRWNALLSSLILGAAWALWHLPMFLSNGFGHHDYHLPFGQFCLTLILVSILVTWLQNNTDQSLVPAFVLHAMVNLSGEVLPLLDKKRDIQGDCRVWMIVNILLFLAAVAVVGRWGHRRMIRER